MFAWLSSLPIQATPVLATVYAASLLVAAALVLPFGRLRARRTRWYAVVGVAVLAGATLGWLIVRQLGIDSVFGVQFSRVVRAAGAMMSAGTVLAVANLVRTRWWRKAIAITAIPLFAVSGALMINADFAYYPTLGAVSGITGVGTLRLSPARYSVESLQDWTPPATMPARGAVGTVSIPGTVSGFAAREAWVWLPPAALTPTPPRLPVVVALTGQPGSPSDLFLAAHLDTTLDAIAAAHHGIAPIVVVPDQLGDPMRNPMCVDSPLGRVSTYITTDVRRWILEHEPVSSDRRQWTIAGYSEGATCAIQFGSRNPDLFGNVIDVSGELAPTDGPATVHEAFHDSTLAYRDATPLYVMSTHHYAATNALFVAGEDDLEYRSAMQTVASGAAAAGMRVQTRIVRDCGHDWNTATRGFAWGLTALVPTWDLPD